MADGKPTTTAAEPGLAVEVYAIESWSDGAGVRELRLSARLAYGRTEPTEEEGRIIGHAIRNLERELSAEGRRVDPKEIAQAKQEREELLGAFAAAGWPVGLVSEVPNTYWPQRPEIKTYLVETAVGPISIGWRKSVIEIDWSKSRLQVWSEDLFPGENVTKDGPLIHARGAEKAREYLAVLRQHAETGGGR